MESKPTINILTRTSGRPNYFKNCIESVKNQTYTNINHIISVDDDETEEYVKKYTDNYIRVEKFKGDMPSNHPENLARRAAPYNLYLNDLKDQVKEGWVMFLDDDDYFLDDDALTKTMGFSKSNDDLIFWKVKFPGRIIPEKRIFDRHMIVLNHFSMIGFMYHSKYNNNAKFDYFSGGDFHFISQLAPTIPTALWIDDVYTGIQRTNNMGGFGKKDDIS